MEPFNCKTVSVKALLSKDRRNDPQLLGGWDFRSNSSSTCHVFYNGLPASVIYSLAASSTKQHITIGVKFVFAKLVIFRENQIGNVI
ncbi:UNVERIFIED_CONTAM: hypothetical protein FKN15_021977 [Acipenser sinensis]